MDRTTALVASVHFFPVSTKRNYRGARYEIPAVGLNAEPTVIQVHSLIQRDWGAMISGTNKRQEHRWPVLADEIAQDIVGEWTGNTTVGLGMTPMCHPGIWFVRERLPVIETQQKIVNGEAMTYEERMMLDGDNRQMFRDATEPERKAMWDEDLAAARAADRIYAEWCWNDGNRIWDRDKHTQLIPPMHRAAAKQYGLNAAWLKEAASSEAFPCPHCGALGSKNTFICQVCQQPTDLEKWAQFQARKEAAMADATGKKRALPPPVTLPSPHHVGA